MDSCSIQGNRARELMFRQVSLHEVSASPKNIRQLARQPGLYGTRRHANSVFTCGSKAGCSSWAWSLLGPAALSQLK